MFQIQDSDREIIARLRNCVVTLTDHGVMLFNTSLQYAYDASLKHSVSNPARQVWFMHVWLDLTLTHKQGKKTCIDLTLSLMDIFLYLCFQVKELLKPEIQEEIADTVRQRLIQEL